MRAALVPFSPGRSARSGVVYYRRGCGVELKPYHAPLEHPAGLAETPEAVYCPSCACPVPWSQTGLGQLLTLLLVLGLLGLIIVALL